MPSSRAVFMLTTKSKVIGCSTGRSAGLAPLRIRIRSTKHVRAVEFYRRCERKAAEAELLRFPTEPVDPDARFEPTAKGWAYLAADWLA